MHTTTFVNSIVAYKNRRVLMINHLQTRVHFPLITSLILSSLEITPSDSISCNPNNAPHFSYPTPSNPNPTPPSPLKWHHHTNQRKGVTTVQ